MRRSYWRALVGQLRAWFGGPGNVLLTVIGIVGVTVIGVLSAIFQLHGWAPVVVTAAVVLVFAEEVGFQAWKGQRGAIDQAHIAARQTAAFRAHVDDLHRWAREACDTLNWDEQRLTVEMDDLLAVCFAIHYPDAATAVHETNERVLYREAVAKTFNESAKMIAAMVPGEAVPECVNFLLWIGERPDDGSADVWEIGDGGAVIVTPAGLGSSYLVAQAQRREDVESTLEAAKRAAALMRNHDASQALRTMADDASVRKRALDTLRDVALDHDPPNECPKCPSLGVVGYQKIDGTPTMPS